MLTRRPSSTRRPCCRVQVINCLYLTAYIQMYQPSVRGGVARRASGLSMFNGVLTRTVIRITFAMDHLYLERKYSVERSSCYARG